MLSTMKKLSLMLVMATMTTPGLTMAQGVSAEASTDFLRRINALRARNGRPAMCLSAKLAASAQSHSEEQRRFRVMSHVGPRDGSQLDRRVVRAGFASTQVAENVAAGQATAEGAFKAWESSSGHLANMLNPNLAFIGLGHDGGYWTLVLAGSATESCNSSPPAVRTAPAPVMANNANVIAANTDASASARVNSTIRENRPAQGTSNPGEKGIVGMVVSLLSGNKLNNSSTANSGSTNAPAPRDPNGPTSVEVTTPPEGSTGTEANNAAIARASSLTLLVSVALALLQ